MLTMENPSSIDLITQIIAVLMFYYGSVWAITRVIAWVQIREGFEGGIYISHAVRRWLFLFTKYPLTAVNRYSWYIYLGLLWSHASFLFHVFRFIWIQTPWTNQWIDSVISSEIFVFLFDPRMMILGFAALFITMFRYIIREILRKRK